ncbi:MAG: ORF6N domain-containing protein [Deltaproteobacteria bacterium]|nr:ORF6N domain-containing protein [Deltaproteobacteria bacterium]
MRKLFLIEEKIQQQILLLRGHKVMLSQHLAKLYGVETRVLIQAVKRNKGRFPGDFVFQLTADEFSDLKSQIVISSWGGARRSRPYAFTEQGVAMLSSVLKSKRAVEVNVQIMRVFVRLRKMAITQKEFALRLAGLEQKIGRHDGHIQAIFEAIRQLMVVEEKPKRSIGFHKE